MNVPDVLVLALNIIKGRVAIPRWLKLAILRAGFLVVTTILLLVSRIKVMGAQLPVFTRCVQFTSCASCFFPFVPNKYSSIDDHKKRIENQV